jgi:hypothetical protein
MAPVEITVSIEMEKATAKSALPTIGSHQALWK